tara:strand:+ start:1321 stop:3891 length:2571 start_codon:yes stop_codon:yes gene_type:complete
MDNLLRQQGIAAASASAGMALQKEEAEKSATDRIQDLIKQPIDIVSGEMVRSGLTGVGKYLSRKTGIKAFEGFSDLFQKEGFEKAFSKTLAKASDEAYKQGGKALRDKVVKRLSAQKQKLQDALEKKFGDVKNQVKEKLSDVEQIAKDKLDQATDKLGDVEQLAKDKLGQVTDKLGDVQSQVEDKLGDLQSQAEDKLGDVQSQLEDKATDLQSQVEDKLPQDQLDNINKFIAEKEDKASSFKTQAEKDYENGKQNLKNKINKKNTNEGKPTLDDDDLNQDASLKDIIKSKQDLQDTGKLSKNETLNRINNLDDDFKSDALIDLGDHSDEVVKQNLTPKEQEESMRAKSQELMEEGEKKQAERNNPKPSAEEDDDDDEMPPLEDQEGNILPSEPSMEEQIQTLRGNLKPSTEPTKYTEEETSGKSLSKAPAQEEDLFDDFGNVKGDYDITDFHTQQYNISKQSSQIQNARQPNQAESELGDFKTKPVKRSELLEDQNKENFKDQIEDLDNKPASAEKFSKRTDQIKKQLGGDDDFEESGDGEVPSLLKPPPATITEADLFTDSDNEEEEEKEPEPEPESKQGPIFVDESDDDEPAVDEKEPEPETDEEEEDEKEPEPETEPEPKINPNLEANIDADPELDNDFNPIKSDDEPLKASDGWSDEYDSKKSALEDRYENLSDEGQNLFDKEWSESKISTKGIPDGSMEEETAQRNNISNSSEIMDRAEALTPQQETQAPVQTSTENDTPDQSSTELANQNASKISSENQETEEDDKGSGGGDEDEDEDEDDEGGGADDDILSDLTADSAVLDENPIGDVITGILGIGSLVASAFGGDDTPSWEPTLQSAYQAGTSSAIPG